MVPFVDPNGPIGENYETCYPSKLLLFQQPRRLPHLLRHLPLIQPIPNIPFPLKKPSNPIYIPPSHPLTYPP